MRWLRLVVCEVGEVDCVDYVYEVDCVDCV